MLQGAEQVLARLMHEKDISREFSPIGLTEVVSLRAFLPDGAVNLNRVTKPVGLEHAIKSSETGQLYLDLDPTPGASSKNPNNKWDIVDAIEANIWSFKFVGMADEETTQTAGDAALLRASMA